MKDRSTYEGPLRCLAISALVAALLMALGVGATPAQTIQALRSLGVPEVSNDSAPDSTPGVAPEFTSGIAPDAVPAPFESFGRSHPLGASSQDAKAEPKIEVRFGVIRIEILEGSRTQYGALAVDSKDPEWIRLSIETDLDEEVRSGEIRAEVASNIASEINGLAGAYYKVPELERLKRDLGFPQDAKLASSDRAELMRVHVQKTLDVSIETAEYLMRLLGTEIAANGNGNGKGNGMANEGSDDDTVSSSSSPASSAK